MADPEFLLLGDALWIDFITTAATPPTLADLLPDAAAFHRWTKAVKLSAPAGSADFDTARLLRARLFDLAVAMEAHRAPPPSAIEIINGFLADRAGREQLVRIGGSWRIRFTPGRPPTALEAIASSAAHTLAQPVILIRRCPAPDCRLFMLDEGPQPQPGCRRGCSRRVERRRRSPIIPLVPDE